MFKLPSKSILSEESPTYDYIDSFQTKINCNKSIDKITTEIFQFQWKWVKALMIIRDLIVKPFGLKTKEKFKKNISPYYKIGSKAVFFTVIDRNDNEIILAEEDRHLNFNVSIFKENIEEKITVSITTLVNFNNFWGHIYFFFVKPFHKILIKQILRRLKNEI